jgi:hypothetical protein
VARGEDLVLKVTADTAGLAQGLTPMTKALDGLEHDAQDAENELKSLDGMNVSPTVDIDIKTEAIEKARKDIDRLRNEIAHGVTMGLDTKAAQREVSSLESAVRKLTDRKETVEVDVEVDKEGLATAVEGVESLREGALGLGEAIGGLDGSLSSFAQVAREMVPALADLNETMALQRLQAQANGVAMGRMGTAVSGITSTMAGPWGLAIAGGVGLLASLATKSDETTQATKALSESIDYQTGVLDKNNRAKAAQEIIDNDLVGKAKALGVSTEDMTSALLGNGEALARVNQRLDALTLKDIQDQLAKGSVAVGKTTQDVNIFRSSLNDLLATNQASADKQRLLAEAIGDTGDVVASSNEGLVTNADLWADYGKQVDDSRRALDGMVASLDILNGRFATAREATIAYEKTLDDTNATVAANGKAVTEHGKAFDTNSEKGRANEKALIDLAKASQTMAEARLKDADASGESTTKILNDYAKQRTSLYETARRMGLNDEAAEDYVDSLLATPKELKTNVALTGYDKAKNDIKDLTKDQEISITVELNRAKFDRLPKRIQDAISGNGSVNVGLSSAPVAPAGPTPTVFMQPRLYLDGRPIRAAMRGDVVQAVSSTFAEQRTPRRTR